MRVAHQEVAAHAQQVAGHHQGVPQQLDPHHHALLHHDEDGGGATPATRPGVRHGVIPQSQTFSAADPEYIL